MLTRDNYQRQVKTKEYYAKETTGNKGLPDWKEQHTARE